MLLDPSDHHGTSSAAWRTRTPRRRPISDFFASCGGADLGALRDSPSSRTFMVALGACAFCFSVMSGFMLMVAVDYATGGDDPWKLWYVGVLWVGIMLSLERLVLNITGGSTKATVGAAIPRIIVSLLLALAIAHTAALKIFDPEIDNILSQNRVQQLDAAEKKVEQTYGSQITVARDEIARLQANERTVQERTTRYDLRANTARTVAGICAIRCSYYTRLAEDSRGRLAAMQDRNEGRITELRDDVRDLAATRLEVLRDRQASIKNQNGLLARVDALDTLKKDNGAVTFQVWLLNLLLIALDLTPLVAKLTRSLTLREGDPYDLSIRGRQAEESLTGKERMERARTEEDRFKAEGAATRRRNHWRYEQEEFARFDTDGGAFTSSNEPKRRRRPIPGRSLDDFVGNAKRWENRPITVPAPLRRAGLIGLGCALLTAVLAIALTFVQDGDPVSGLLFVLMATFTATVLFVYTKGFRTAPKWGLQAIFFTLIGGLMLPFCLLLVNL